MEATIRKFIERIEPSGTGLAVQKKADVFVASLHASIDGRPTELNFIRGRHFFFAGGGIGFGGGGM